METTYSGCSVEEQIKLKQSEAEIEREKRLQSPEQIKLHSEQQALRTREAEARAKEADAKARLEEAKAKQAKAALELQRIKMEASLPAKLPIEDTEMTSVSLN